MYIFLIYSYYAVRYTNLGLAPSLNESWSSTTAAATKYRLWTDGFQPVIRKIQNHSDNKQIDNNRYNLGESTICGCVLRIANDSGSNANTAKYA